MPKWCDDGETEVGNVYLKGQSRTPFYLGLYMNATEPAEGAALSSITEPSGNGYARIVLADADWTEQATKGEFLHTQKAFSASGGNWGQVYGYFITDQASGTAGKLKSVEHFSDGPYTVNANWAVKVTPKIVIQ
jgi:hypothetical protein